MKAGSLVVCLEDIGELPFGITCNRPTPKKGDIETVAEITDTDGLVLEGFEFTIPNHVSFIIHLVVFDAKY